MLHDAGYRTGTGWQNGDWGTWGRPKAACRAGKASTSSSGFLNQQHAHNHFPDFLWQNEQRVSLPNKIAPGWHTAGAGFGNRRPGSNADDLFADALPLQFVADNKSRPFFLYWCMVIPHANNERTRALKNGAHVPDFGPYTDKSWPEPDKGQAAM